jgi:ABC-type nitrate/sulfonate/bicarbonate transport system substrate-binding protein
LLINPATTDDMLMAIRKSEGFANLEKAAKQLKAAFRSGLIDDYDEIDLRMLLGHRQLTGGGLRQRK